MQRILPSFTELEQSRGQRARERLLLAAIEVFGEKGPRAATVREIARAAGQNVAAIAYYFGSKEKLYFVVIEGLVREMRRRLADVFAETRAFRERSAADREEALRLLKRFLRAIYENVLSREEAVPLARLIIREQLKPSAGFEVLYAQGFLDLHRSICHLVGIALGLDPETPETMVRTHFVMGQVYFFAMTREAILRRLGWKSLEGAKAQWVAGLLEEHVDALIKGLRGKPDNKSEPRNPKSEVESARQKWRGVGARQ